MIAGLRGDRFDVTFARRERMPTRDAREARRSERRRLSARLHDDVQQLLVGAQMQVHAVLQREDDVEKQALLQTAADCLLQALEAIRNLSVDLSPPIQFEDGLVPALHWLSNWMETHHNLHCDIQSDTDIRDSDLGSIVFDCVRQLSLNAVKHAGVDSITLRVRREDGGVSVIVQDQGRGFDPGAVNQTDHPNSGFGLAKIRREIEAVRGRFRVDSAPGRGTAATLWVPLTETPAD
jgi:signal transduction histidine kinase